MRKLVLKMSISLDGFVSGPNGETDWIFRTADSDSTAWVVDTIRQAGAHVMGSRTYYDMAAFWPYSQTPFAASMNDIPKIIFSRHGIKDGTKVERTTREPADAKQDLSARQSFAPTAAVLKSWAEPLVAGGHLVEDVARLKAQPGDYMLVHGGARFAQSLVASGLIDEYRLVIHPVALGGGQPLFPALRAPLDLRMISATSFGSGVVGAVYQSA